MKKGGKKILVKKNKKKSSHTLTLMHTYTLTPLTDFTQPHTGKGKRHIHNNNHHQKKTQARIMVNCDRQATCLLFTKLIDSIVEISRKRYATHLLLFFCVLDTIFPFDLTPPYPHMYRALHRDYSIASSASCCVAGGLCGLLSMGVSSRVPLRPAS